jgi:PAS domain S-box-containing protein
LAKTCGQTAKPAASEKRASLTEKIYEHFFNLSNDILCVAGLDGYFKLINPALEKTLGYSKEELLAKPFIEFVHPEDREKNLNELQGVHDGEPISYCENRYLCKDGSYKWLAWTDYMDVNEGLIYVVGRDITERKQEFHTMMDFIPDNLVLLSPDLKIMWANKAAADAFGKAASELAGKYCLSVCGSPPDNNYPSIKSFRTGKEEASEISTPDGRAWDVRAFPIKDESGKVKNVIELARDITAKVRMGKEAKLMQVKLIQANKMSALGTLVSGIAHEINNPNSFIMSNAQLLSGIWKDAVKILSEHYHKSGDFSLGGLSFSELSEIMPKLLNGMNDGTVRIKNIIDNLRDFARQDKAGLDGKVDIQKAITASTAIISNQIKKYTDNFNIDCKKDIPIVKGNIQQIEQVLINLIMNSLQALPDKNCKVRISASFNKKSDCVEIEVIDEGVGMSKDVLERITEPFFTTKIDSGGTGLGLSISYAIIKEHNGSLEFESAPGKGTTAVVKLPVHNKK